MIVAPEEKEGPVILAPDQKIAIEQAHLKVTTVEVEGHREVTV